MVCTSLASDSMANGTNAPTEANHATVIEKKRLGVRRERTTAAVARPAASISILAIALKNPSAVVDVLLSNSETLSAAPKTKMAKPGKMP